MIRNILYCSFCLFIRGLTDAVNLPTVICSWCGKLLRKGTLPISHGICPSCVVKFEREA